MILSSIVIWFECSFLQSGELVSREFIICIVPSKWASCVNQTELLHAWPQFPWHPCMQVWRVSAMLPSTGLWSLLLERQNSCPEKYENRKLLNPVFNTYLNSVTLSDCIGWFAQSLTFFACQCKKATRSGMKAAVRGRIRKGTCVRPGTALRLQTMSLVPPTGGVRAHLTIAWELRVCEHDTAAMTDFCLLRRHIVLNTM